MRLMPALSPKTKASGAKITTHFSGEAKIAAPKGVRYLSTPIW